MTILGSSARWLLSLWLIAFVSSCALAPVKLQRLGIGDSWRTSSDLGVLLEKSVENSEATSALARFIEVWKAERGAVDSGEVLGPDGHRYQVSYTGGAHGGYPLS